MAGKAKLAYFEGNGKDQANQALPFTKEGVRFWCTLWSLFFFFNAVKSWCFGHVFGHILEGKEARKKEENFCTWVQKQGLPCWGGGRQCSGRGGSEFISLQTLSKKQVCMLHEHALKTLAVHIFWTKVLLLHLSFWFMLLREHRAAVRKKEKSHMADYRQTNKHIQYRCQTDFVQTKGAEKQPYPPLIPLYAFIKEYLPGFLCPSNLLNRLALKARVLKSTCANTVRF